MGGDREVGVQFDFPENREGDGEHGDVVCVHDRAAAGSGTSIQFAHRSTADPHESGVIRDLSRKFACQPFDDPVISIHHMIAFVTEHAERGELGAAVGMNEEEKREAALFVCRESILSLIGGNDGSLGKRPSRDADSVLSFQVSQQVRAVEGNIVRCMGTGRDFSREAIEVMPHHRDEIAKLRHDRRF